MGGDTSRILAAPWAISQGRNHRHERWISWEAGEWGETASFTETIENDVKISHRICVVVSKKEGELNSIL